VPGITGRDRNPLGRRSADPEVLSAAGFDVTLLAPKDTLAAASRYLAQVSWLRDRSTAVQWMESLAAVAEDASAQLVLPADDMAFLLLSMMKSASRESIPIGARLEALIELSLGDPNWCLPSVDKTALPAAAQALGIRIPRSRVVDNVADATAFAASSGFPVLLKRSHSSAGDGVRVCDDPRTLALAFVALTCAQPQRFGRTDRRLLVQAHVKGRHKNFHMAAWDGRLLTGYAAEKLQMHPPLTGPSTVQRFHHDATITAIAERLVQGFGISGLLSLECVIDGKSGDAYLIEINRRWSRPRTRGARSASITARRSTVRCTGWHNRPGHASTMTKST
jgi:predicted ATP-grasp superfamily ATP-dependent carboligase